MAVLGGGAVSYERGTPVASVSCLAGIDRRGAGLQDHIEAGWIAGSYRGSKETAPP